jgi:hypothetical protein
MRTDTSGSPPPQSAHRLGASAAVTGILIETRYARPLEVCSTQALVEEKGLGDYATSALAHVVSARTALNEGRRGDARPALARVHRLRPLLDRGLPWLTVEVGLELVRAHLALGEAAAARPVLTETRFA